ncbi:MAG: putative lipase/esterase [Sphingobacteriales bacterium]|nr:putative lipase/esterase [Sphingobacteriales bacterium]
MRVKLILFWLIVWSSTSAVAQEIRTIAGTEYKIEYSIPYCSVDGKILLLNAFLPLKASKPAPVMIDIHGGWWSGGNPSTDISGILARKGIAMFSISYRLGEEGGFPQNIRDCRNAIRFIRKNAARFNIDTARFSVMGGSAGGHLSLMVAMVPENFDDGGPTEELKGISARVSSCFSYIAPTDFIRFWNQGPDDVLKNTDGTISYRNANPDIPYDSRPRFRVLFHGITPDTDTHKDLYRMMSPVNYVRKTLPPLLICDGDIDPIVPGLHGKILHEKLLAVGADSSYWMTINGGHNFPGGPGFAKVLDDFLNRTLSIKNTK